MKSQKTDQKRVVRWLSTVLLFGITLTLMLPAGAWAAGTASGTSISNQATITYAVGSVGQPAIQSDGDGNLGNGPEPTAFVVDNLVDLSVSTLDAGIVDVAPGASAMVLRFRLDNEGNTTQDFLLSAVGQATGGPYATPFGSLMDAFDADTGTNPVRIYLDETAPAATSGYTAGTWSGTGLESAVTYIDELQADFSVTVFIVIDIPAGQADGDMAIYGLLAQVAAGGGAGAQGAAIASDDSGAADDPATVQIVFGDAVGADDPDTSNPDGYHSSRSVFRILGATLAATKATTVVWDPVNLGSNPKAIPGARVEYAIAVDNTGSSQADNVVITDHIMQFTTDVTFVSGSASAANNDGGVTPVIEYSADGATWNAAETSPVNYVRATNSSIQAGSGQATLVFQVTIN